MSQVARELGIGGNMLSRWRRKQPLRDPTADQPVEHAIEFVEDLIEQGENAPQWVVVRHTGLHAHVAEPGRLLDVV